MAALTSFLQSPSFQGFTALPDHVQCVSIVLLSAITHAILFFCTSGKPFVSKDTKDPKARVKEEQFARSCIVSCFHATLVIAFIYVWWTAFGVEFAQTFWDANVMMGADPQPAGFAFMKLILSFSLGYFLYDSICMFMCPAIASAGSYFHHILVSVSIVSGLIDHIAQPYHFLFLLEEFSTPFLNLKGLTKNKPTLNFWMSLGFMFSFIFSRSIFGSYLFYNGAINAWAYAESQWALSTAAANWRAFLAIYQSSACGAARILNAYWAFLILKKAFDCGKQSKIKKSD
jgi:hypothetical protein